MGRLFGLSLFGQATPVPSRDLDPKFYKGAAFTIIVHSNSHYARCDKMDNYIQSAKLNGQPLNRPWVTYDEIASGGTLELEMGILPNKSWGSVSETSAQQLTRLQ